MEATSQSGSPGPPPPPAVPDPPLAASAGGGPIPPPSRQGPLRPGQAALLVVAAFTLVEGIGVAIGGSDLHLTAALALLIGGVLYALAMVGRLLRPVPEIRSLLALVGTLIASAGIGVVSDGLPPPLRVGLTGVAGLLLAGAASQLLPSAVAAALAALAVIATPSLVIGAAGGGIVAVALAGAVALAIVVLVSRGPWRLPHPASHAWVSGTAALVGAALVGVLADLDGGVALVAAAAAAVGLVTAAQRRGSVVLGFAAFLVVSATVTAAVALMGASTSSVAAILIVAGVLLAATAVLAGAFSSRRLAVSGAPALPLPFEEMVIALAAILTLVAATGTPGGGFSGSSPFSPVFGFSTGGSGSGSFTFPIAPVPTNPNGLPCPSFPPGFGPPTPPPGFVLPTPPPGFALPSLPPGFTPPNGCPGGP